jgi:hypothetical protein
MAELTPAGYKLKPQNEWFAEERALYLQIDPSWNLDPSTPDGLKMAHDAEIFSALDEALQQAYNSKDPKKAKGQDLDTVCALTGTLRSKGSGSSVALTLTGTPGTVVPAGTPFDSAITGARFAIDQGVVIGAGGTVSVNATCSVVGPTQADANTITKIVTVIGGLTGVTNPAVATLGTDKQKDDSLRIERATAVGRPGNNQVDSAIGELFAVPGVRRVKAYENDTGSDSFDANENPHSLPKNSMSYIIDGGTDADVAMAIYLKKNPGVRLYQPGTPFEVLVTSPKYPSNTKLIKASRPVYVDMTVAIALKSDGSLPSNIQDEIREAFMEFAAGDLVPADVGFKISGFDIGEDVPHMTLATPVNKVIGRYGNSYIDTMTVNGTAVTPGGKTEIAFNKMSRWTESNITVTVS